MRASRAAGRLSTMLFAPQMADLLATQRHRRPPAPAAPRRRRSSLRGLRLPHRIRSVVAAGRFLARLHGIPPTR